MLSSPLIRPAMRSMVSASSHLSRRGQTSAHGSFAEASPQKLRVFLFFRIRSAIKEWEDQLDQTARRDLSNYQRLVRQTQQQHVDNMRHAVYTHWRANARKGRWVSNWGTGREQGLDDRQDSESILFCGMPRRPEPYRCDFRQSPLNKIRSMTQSPNGHHGPTADPDSTFRSTVDAEPTPTTKPSPADLAAKPTTGPEMPKCKGAVVESEAHLKHLPRDGRADNDNASKSQNTGSATRWSNAAARKETSQEAPVEDPSTAHPVGLLKPKIAKLIQSDRSDADGRAQTFAEVRHHDKQTKREKKRAENLAAASTANEAESKKHSVTWKTSELDGQSKTQAVRAQEPDRHCKAVETQHKDVVAPEELDEDVALRADEPDGMYKAAVDEAATQSTASREELRRYEAFRIHELDGKDADSSVKREKDASAAERTRHSKVFGKHEPKCKCAAEQATTHDSEPVVSERMVCGIPICSDEPNGKWAEDRTKEADADEKALRSWRPLEEFMRADASKSMPLLSEHGPGNEAELAKHQPVLYNEPDEKSSPVSTECAGQGSGRTNYRRMLDALMPGYQPLEGLTSVTYSLDSSLQSATMIKTPPTPAPAAPATPTATRTLYQILVYNHANDKVDSAMTISSIAVDMPPMAPHEAFHQLSHPAAFLSHMKMLRSAEYEIVSGKDDVLVLRQHAKEEEAAAATAAIAAAVDAKTKHDVDTPTAAATSNVNPIDMMGAALPDVAASRFASPTGYVNYEWPEEQTTTPSAKHDASTADKPGRSTRGKKTSATKRLVRGVVWLGGLLYAIAVMAKSSRTAGVARHAPDGLVLRPRSRFGPATTS